MTLTLQIAIKTGILLQIATIAASVVDVCKDGTYRNPAGPKWVAGCPGYSLCPAGFFCVHGALEPCPPGKFSDSQGLSTCQICPPGFYCPQAFDATTEFHLLGCSKPIACGSFDVFCPGGAHSPSIVQAGHYSVGDSADGSTQDAQVIAPLGFYAQNGQKSICPGGRYGSSLGLTSADCSGLCSEGYYCAAGSTSPKQNPCGSKLLFCPSGSTNPQRIKLPGRHPSTPEADPQRPAFYTEDQHDNDSRFTETVRVQQVICPVGHYCIDGTRNPCPPGRYGDREGQHSPLCSGQCTAGYYCPAASTRSQSIQCGANLNHPESVFCPAGSSLPTPAAEGHFTVNGERMTRRAQQQCPSGHFCQNGISKPCSKGRYGSSVGLSAPLCDGPCAPGFFCPEEGSATPTAQRCGTGLTTPASVFCPIGSFQPIKVKPGFRTIRLTAGGSSTGVPAHTTNPLAAAGLGAMLSGMTNALDSHWQRFSIQVDATELASLHTEAANSLATTQTDRRAESYLDVMRPMFARVEGLAQLHHDEYFVFEDFFVAQSFHNSSRFSLLVREHGSLELQTHEVACKLGHYCAAGRTFPCPSGRFGAEYNLTDAFCSGVCERGYYCPLASTTSRMAECGRRSAFCPEGSAQSQLVPNGFLGKGVSPQTQFQLVSCPLGTYCKLGIATLCPPGRFGNGTSLATEACSGECEAGYFCPLGSTTPRSKRCQGPREFCPAGSAQPQNVSEGYYTVHGRTRPTPAAHLSLDTQSVCYGTAGPMDAPPSIENAALFSENINSTFDPARYCRSGRTGDWDERKAQDKCPSGSFCINGLRYLCPPGRFGSTVGSDRPHCDGICQSGFYCPWGSTSSTQLQCGAPDTFCPAGSGAPQPVPEGFFTNEDGPPTQKSSKAVCPRGHFCTGGQRHACARGRFGAQQGLASPLCSGPCSAGYYCPDEATLTNKPKECGSSSVFCPAGSIAPTTVPSGTYSVGGFEQRIGFSENRTRTGWENCPPGHFCAEGKLYQCPGGFWGNNTNEIRPHCSGSCAAGHFCPPGSLSPTAFKCGEVFLQRQVLRSDANMSVAEGDFVNVFDFAAGGGAVGSGRGGGGPTGATADWIAQLQHEQEVIDGFLSNSLPTNSEELHAIQVDVLSMATAASRQQRVTDLLGRLQLGGMLPNVTIAWNSGYRFKYPAADIQVGQYELYGFRLVNGGSAVFCPVGSAFPSLTESGYYSEGPLDAFNRTQSSQTMCPPGSYCVSGIRYPCAPGRYGSSHGVVSRFCTAACPAGSSCPIGSAFPQECADGTYSGGGMAVCSECPEEPAELQLRDRAIHAHTFGSANPDVDVNTLYKQQRCKTSRLCCGL